MATFSIFFPSNREEKQRKYNREKEEAEKSKEEERVKAESLRQEQKLAEAARNRFFPFFFPFKSN